MSRDEITNLETKVLLSADGRIALVEISQSRAQGKLRKRHIIVDVETITESAHESGKLGSGMPILTPGKVRFILP